MKKFAKLAVAGLIAGLSFASQAGVVIDDFTIGQAVGPGPGFVKLLSDNTADGLGIWNSATGPVGNILGGERDMFISALTTDGAGAGVTASVSGGLLKYSTDTGASGRSIIKWDGVNGSAAPSTGSESDYLNPFVAGGLNVAGLNNLDLAATGSGFKIKVKESDLGFDFAITVFTDLTHWTTLILQSQAHHNFLPDNTPIDFADFQGATCSAFSFTSDPLDLCAAPSGSGAFYYTGVLGSADMGDVGAILATINFSGSEAEIDLQIDDVRTVPEPASLSLVGIALLGLGALRRRKTAAK